jgi:hypothetical protein
MAIVGKRMRQDELKSLERVSSYLLQNPQATLRQVSNGTGLSLSAVKNAKKNLGRTDELLGDSRVVLIKEKDLEIVMHAQKLILEELVEESGKDVKERKVKLRELADIAEKSQKRHAFLAGEKVNEEGGEKQSVKIEVVSGKKRTIIDAGELQENKRKFAEALKDCDG